MSFLGVGAGEAALIFIITLIVVGPHRFPEVMRTAGRWYRMARAYSNEVMKDVRAAVDDIEREVKAETDDFSVVRDLSDLQDDLKGAREVAEDAQRGTREVIRDTERSAGADASAASTPPAASTPEARPTEPRPIRPSQRQEGEQRQTPAQLHSMAAASFRAARERTAQSNKDAAGSSTPLPTSGDEPAEPASSQPTEATSDTANASAFDPFAQQSARRGPVHVRPEPTPPADGEEPADAPEAKDGESA